MMYLDLLHIDVYLPLLMFWTRTVHHTFPMVVLADDKPEDTIARVERRVRDAFPNNVGWELVDFESIPNRSGKRVTTSASAGTVRTVQLTSL